MKAKITVTENELMGRHRTPDYAGVAVKADVAEEALAPSLEAAELKVNQGCIDSALVLIGCLQMNHDNLPRFDEADRKATLGTGDTKDWRAYGDLHLAIDAGKPEETRMHYRHAVIKDGVVYTRVLKKLCTDDNAEIAASAWRLCKAAGLTVENSVARPQRAQLACPVMAAGRSCPMNSAGRCCHLNDSGGCKIAGEACLLVSADKLACPLMAAGEGSPMDAWSGCAQLTAEAECRLQDEAHCCMCKETEEDEE